MRVPSLIETLPDRWRDPSMPAYPWWIPAIFIGMAFCTVGAAVSQRLGTEAFWPTAGLALVTLTPWFFDVAGRKVSWVYMGGLTMAASAVVVIRYPVEYDILPVIWTVLAGHFGAVEKLWRGAAATAAAALLVVVLAANTGFDGATLWVGGIVLGWDIGVVMQFQQRRIDEQLASEEARREQALLAERQRIAREVHDVVAHSLSVTMLHLTAARRELEQDGADGVPEAIDALRDAEKVGRQAMGDIRRTVGVLAEGEAPDSGANPDLSDVDQLLEDFRAAGLDVELELRGDPTSVAPNAALSLYRIVQESLANVAKHQPHAHTLVRLDLRDGQRLVVENDLDGLPRRNPGGAGLTGMAQRADLLGGTFRAGPEGGRWRVEVVVPARAGHTCPLGLVRTQPAPVAGTT